MTASFGGSAKIYQFPKGGRAGLSNRFDAETEKRVPRIAEAVSGGAWYHEEAIREGAVAARKT